nr:hypothetical protein [Tanacetum cinerariifolium]
EIIVAGGPAAGMKPLPVGTLASPARTVAASIKCKLLAVGSPFFWQWKHPPLAVGTYTASGNSLLAVGMPCAFYSQQSLL